MQLSATTVPISSKMSGILYCRQWGSNTVPLVHVVRSLGPVV